VAILTLCRERSRRSRVQSERADANTAACAAINVQYALPKPQIVGGRKLGAGRTRRLRQALGSWEKPQLKAYRLVIPSEHKSNSFLRRRPRPDHRRLSYELLQFLSLKAEITFDG
jgi:hypothetical protein